MIESRNMPEYWPDPTPPLPGPGRWRWRIPAQVPSGPMGSPILICMYIRKMRFLFPTGNGSLLKIRQKPRWPTGFGKKGMSGWPGNRRSKWTSCSGIVERVLDRHEAQLGYTTCFLYNVQTCRLLFDRDDWWGP